MIAMSASRRAPRARKAVVPAAGLGTRFLPATKATPKEMLPVVDKPAIRYVVEEAAAAGLDDLLTVTGRHKRAIEDHFDHAFEREQALAAKGDTVRLDAVRDPARLADIHHIRQGDPLGLGHAVLCARNHVGDQPFAVLLGDDLIDPRETLLSRMLDVRDRYAGGVVALMEVPPEQVHLYGCGEIQLTDALQELAAGGTVHGVVFSGRRYDTGDKAGYLRTVVGLACDRPDLGPEFTAWLKEFVASPEDGDVTREQERKQGREREREQKQEPEKRQEREPAQRSAA
ncbi:UTP--glucose-1-phosphate uridylyltransferase [Streptomyces achromogenes]|nr:UTP--glucose-1-phosphate uridylyltransferase [Streptomyces achromogenes]